MNKPNIVLLPDYGNHSSEQLNQIIKLLAEDFDIHVIDYPGVDMSTQILVSYIEDMLRIRVDGKFHIFGIHGGSILATRYADRFPERVHSVSFLTRDHHYLADRLRKNYGTMVKILDIPVPTAYSESKIINPAFSF